MIVRTMYDITRIIIILWTFCVDEYQGMKF